MTTKTRTNFLGIPVEGDPDLRRGHSVAQRPIEDLGPALHAVLDHPDVLAIRWRQYTPYFNDGDTCEFGVGDVEFKLRGYGSGLSDYDDDEDDDEEQPSASEGHYVSSYFIDRGPGRYVKKTIPNPNLGKEMYGYWGRTRGEIDNRTHVEEDEWESTGPITTAQQAINNFTELFNSGAFEDALYDAFGDHAIVTLTKDKAEIEAYSHD